ncbi:MAG: hypothetical protein KAR20_12970 [Candidatus Heimdallarchaeota archaeon]|nr:hypothetical protein [Candidatus Heimdallarchaeota archaeon]
MFTSFRKKVLVGVFLFSMVFTLTGCIYMVIGGVGALGGYVVSPDTVEGIISGRDETEVWDAAYEIASIMGVIEEQSEQGGVIIVNIQGNKITITISRMSTDSLRMSVKGRKAFLPKVRLAQDVYVKIMNYLEM